MKKKILHIQVLPMLAGVQKISLDILSNLSDEEYEKWILFSDDMDEDTKKNCEQAFKKNNVKVIFSKKIHREICFSDIAALIEIYRLCRNEKFDIVHTNSSKPGIIGRIAAFCARVPLVVHTVHGLAFHDFVKFPVWQFYWLCEMIASLFCHKIVLVNQYYLKYFKCFKHKTTTIYNAIQYESLPENNINTRGNTPLKVLYVGRLDTQKDPITMLRAAQIVIDKFPNCFFTIVGGGERYCECEKYVEENSLSGKIDLVGWQNDVSSYYASHNVFISSSIYEAFGLVFLEAGFYQMPVVATNVEGIPEVVKDGYTGLLFNPKDYNKFAEFILKLLTDEDMRIKYGENAKQWVTTNFTIDKMVKLYIELYDK